MFSRRNAAQSILMHWAALLVATGLVLAQRQWNFAGLTPTSWYVGLALAGLGVSLFATLAVTGFAAYAGAVGQALPKTQLWDMPTLIGQIIGLSLLGIGSIIISMIRSCWKKPEC